MTFKALALAVAMVAVGSSAAHAELRRVEIKTLGMDWETCAHAVRVAMQKVPGITSVRVSLNEGLTVLELAPGNTITLARVREIIRNNGFPTREAITVAIGSAIAVGSDVAFEVSGTGERFPISAATAEQRQRADELRAKINAGALRVTGSIDTRDPKAMTLTVSAIAAP